MDDLDRSILNLIQAHFPLVAEPYKAMGEELRISGEEVKARLERLKAGGFIRRLGAIFDSRKLGYASTLCALEVPEQRIEEVAGIVNSYPGVTHNYLREHRYNMWFTVIAQGNEELISLLDDIEARTGLKPLNLPAVRFFKVRVDFQVKGEIGVASDG